ncbi:MAG: hypothetical protein Q3959_06290 [Limosilactobacillus sp.]|uniref:hypothetical protein n=1 Tax=Limosilactobacillus sp. TaxID=2773925 RepID=UPI002703F3A5|nr:hypothetical protein [Limosilactobacillus sp.]
MNYLTIPFLKALLKKKEAKIALAFSLYPLILIVAGLFDTNFMQLNTLGKVALSFSDFVDSVISTQYQMTLPLIVFIYIVTTLFREEFSSGIIYLYKDVSRMTILNAKIGSIVIFQFIYLALTFLSSLFTYYVYLVHQSIASGQFLSPRISDLQYSIVSSVGTILVFILCMMVTTLASITLTNGFTILVGILFALVSFIAPSLNSLKYIFPNGYANIFGHMSFANCILIELVLFIVYFVILYIVALSKYKKIQY